MTTDQPLVMGTNEQGVANAWFVALGRLVAQAGAGLSTVPVPERPTTPLPTHNLCRIELTGLVALGNLQKARSGVLRDRANSWADRLVVTLPHPAPPCPTRPHPTPPDPTLPLPTPLLPPPYHPPTPTFTPGVQGGRSPMDGGRGAP